MAFQARPSRVRGAHTLVQAWRLVSSRRAATAFDGEGSALYGNRWNQVGTRVVYLAATVSLAALEVLVHAESYAELPEYQAFPVEFDSTLVSEPEAFPPDWMQSPAPESTKTLGSEWANRKESVLLKIPSAVVAWEYNYLLNVLHPEFSRVRIGTPKPFAFDPRLSK